MKLIIKEKAFTILDQYDIKYENGDIAYKVKGKLNLTKRLDVYDENGEKVGKVVEKMVSVVPHYKIYMFDECIGDISKDILSLIKDSYSFDYKGWKIKGDLINFNYDIESGRKKIAKISRKAVRILTPTYVIDVEDEKEALAAVMVAVCIFAMQDDEENKKNHNN